MYLAMRIFHHVDPIFDPIQIPIWNYVRHQVKTFCSFSNKSAVFISSPTNCLVEQFLLSQLGACDEIPLLWDCISRKLGTFFCRLVHRWLYKQEVRSYKSFTGKGLVNLRVFGSHFLGQLCHLKQYRVKTGTDILQAFRVFGVISAWLSQCRHSWSRRQQTIQR